MPRYRHTQFGWAVVSSLLLPIGVLGGVAVVAQTLIPFLTLIPLILALACFAWLTVVVTDEVVDLRFGINAGALTRVGR